jgi:hypothetical protein
MIKRVYGCKKDTPDLRDYLYHAKIDTGSLPGSVDLRSKFSPIVDQGELGSCTSNAIVSGLYEYQLLQKGNWKALSRLFHYYEERSLEGTIDSDSGAEISDGMKVLQQIGVCPETDWPYDISTYANAPTAQDLADALTYKIVEYHRVTSLPLLKAALAEGLPVVLGIDVYSSFESDSVSSTGVIPMPDTAHESLLGGHAICAVGYDNAKSAVIFRNSWGPSWGDQGHGYLPYAYFKSLVSDMWTSTDSETTKQGGAKTSDSNTGSISVNVYDAMGNAISGAEITYTVDGVSGFTAVTNAVGNTEVTGLPLGSYTLTISATGYVGNTAAVNVTGGATTVVNVTLSVTLASVIQSLLSELASEQTTIAQALVDGIIAKLEAEESTSSSIFVKDIRDPIEVALLEQIEASTIPTLATLLVSVLTDLINEKLGANIGYIKAMDNS